MLICLKELLWSCFHSCQTTTQVLLPGFPFFILKQKTFTDNLPVYPSSINSTRTLRWSQMKLCLVSDQIICYICLVKLKTCLAFSLCLPYVPINTFWLISLWHLVIAFICIQCCLSASLLNSLWAMLTDVFQRFVHNSHLVFSQFGLWFWSVRAPLGAGLAVCWGPLTCLPQNNTDEKPPSVSVSLYEQETYIMLLSCIAICCCENMY